MARALLLLTIGASLLAIALSGTALGAGNSVPGTNITRFQTPITANTLKPSSCSGVALTTVVAGVNGTAGADLLLGTAAADTMRALGGNDCVLGGGGNDAINCGAGTDVANGGPGVDTFSANCETQNQ